MTPYRLPVGVMFWGYIVSLCPQACTAETGPGLMEA